MNEVTLLKPIVRRVRDIRYRKSNVSGKFFETGTVTIRKQKELVWRPDGCTQWMSANPGQFNP